MDNGIGKRAAPVDIGTLGRLVVVAAHPDDETLGAGGLIAMAALKGVDIDIVVLTRGEGSHPLSTTHGRDAMTGLRRQEILGAVDVLAPAASIHLHSLPDGALAEHRGEVTDLLAQAVRSVDCETWLVAPWRHDRHADHEAAGAAAAVVANRSGAHLLEYPIWFWHWGSPGEPPSMDRPLRLDLTVAALAAKTAAIDRYASQLRPLSDRPGDEAVVAPRFREHFERPFEIYQATSEEIVGASTARTSLPPAYFDAMYAAETDPWRFRERWYEQRKRDLTMAVLPRRRFRTAFEPGCSIGVLTTELARRCDRVLATDVADAALAAATARLERSPHVRVERRAIPSDWPTGPFDLVVLSEVGYYCAGDDLQALAAAARDTLTDDGCIVACHWRHPVADYPVSGDAVHAALRATTGIDLLAEHVEADFRLDVLVRAPATSVAAAEGLV